MDLGPCHTGQHATGILVTPTGVYRSCCPENWRECNTLSCAKLVGASHDASLGDGQLPGLRQAVLSRFRRADCV